MKLFTLIGLFTLVTARRNAWIYVMNGNMYGASAVEDYFLAMAKAGASHLMSSFLVPGQAGFPATGEADTVAVWKNLASSEQSAIVEKLHSEGTQLFVVSAGGNYGTLYLNYEPVEWARLVCGHAADNHYDGVDMDLENFSGAQATQFVDWAIKATQACRSYVNHISHAPQSPYFHSGWGNAYDKLVDYVDTLLVQFYNQGPTAHADYQSTFIKDANWPTWSDLAAAHPDAKDKFVVGKWIYNGHGGSGQFTPSEFAAAAQKAEQDLGYNAGIMLWRAPQPAEPEYNQFINTDLPMLSARDTEAAVTPKPSHTVVPPATKPSVATKSTTRQVPRTVRTTTTRPPATDGSAVALCQSSIGSSNPTWAQDCRDKCAYYAEQPLWCTEGVTTGTALTSCVKRLHPYCI